MWESIWRVRRTAHHLPTSVVGRRCLNYDEKNISEIAQTVKTFDTVAMAQSEEAGSGQCVSGWQCVNRPNVCRECAKPGLVIGHVSIHGSIAAHAHLGQTAIFRRWSAHSQLSHPELNPT
jgi:hypothetical protein